MSVGKHVLTALLLVGAGCWISIVVDQKPGQPAPKATSERRLSDRNPPAGVYGKPVQVEPAEAESTPAPADESPDPH